MTKSNVLLDMQGLCASVRYRNLREQSYRLTEGFLRKRIGVSLKMTSITPFVIQQANGWGNVDWCWTREVKRFQRRPRRVDIAIWDGNDMLCALSLGRVSDRRIVACIHFVAKNPFIGNLRGWSVMEVITYYLKIYGNLCGCQKICISNPVPALVEYYKTHGFLEEKVKKGRVVSLFQNL